MKTRRLKKWPWAPLCLEMEMRDLARILICACFEILNPTRYEFGFDMWIWIVFCIDLSLLINPENVICNCA